MGVGEFHTEYKEYFEGEYNIFLPEVENIGSINCPLLIFLHGYYPEYNPPEFMEKELPKGLLENSRDFNFILGCPLCPFGFYWRTTFVLSFLNHLIERYKINESKIFLTGHSMGGFGTWATAHEFPERFAGVSPVSGGVSEINQYQTHRLKNLPIWAFHNRGDEIVSFKNTEIMVNSINNLGGKAKLTLYDVDSHDAYVTFQNKELYKWFASLNKQNSDSI